MSAFKQTLNSRGLKEFSQRFFIWVGFLIGLGSLIPAQAQTGARVQLAPAGPVLPSIAHKKEGTTRIGVVQPGVQLGQATTNLMTMTEPLRQLVIQYLGGPNFEAIPITAMLPAQVADEAKRKECDYVLLSSLIQRANSSGFGMLKKAMPIISVIPVVGSVARIGGVVAGGTAVAAMNAADLRGIVKAKSEVTFGYQLMAPDGQSPVLADSARAKAKTDGEDIVTPLVAQADAAILAKLSEKEIK